MGYDGRTLDLKIKKGTGYFLTHSLETAVSSSPENEDRLGLQTT